LERFDKCRRRKGKDGLKMIRQGEEAGRGHNTPAVKKIDLRDSKSALSRTDVKAIGSRMRKDLFQMRQGVPVRFCCKLACRQGI
jgi:hypothetical protein